MAGYLTTHVLDTARGRPAEGLRITLYRIEGEERRAVTGAVTNADGRTNAPILPEADWALGEYELVFSVADYLEGQGGESPFLREIPIRFTLSEDSHYHVPLLLSPFGYSTYRGS